MRLTIALFLILFACCTLFAQSDLQKIVDTEHAFAQMAVEKGTRLAFLAYLTDDALAFVPEQTNARAFWEARKPNTSLLSWAPDFADVSSNGILGYTTGNWEWRKEKDDNTSSFGDFVTLWLRQSDGKFKWVIDIGVDHPKPERYSTNWTTSKPVKSVDDANIKPTGDFTTEFYQLAASKGLAKAYEKFADENIRSYREQKMPILSKTEALKLLKADKAKFTFAKRSTTLTSENLSYTLNTYTRMLGDKAVEKGNFLQIWKFYGGKWHIVLDVFKPVP